MKKYGNYGKLKGNVITYMQEPFQILETFPSLDAYETIQVVLANNIDVKIDLNIMKIFNVRREVVLKFAQWFHKNNKIYKEKIKQIDMNVISKLPENGIPFELEQEITRLSHLHLDLEPRFRAIYIPSAGNPAVAHNAAAFSGARV